RRAMFPEVLMLHGFYRCRAWAAPTGDCYHVGARIGLFGESPARAGTPKAQFRPETLRHMNGRRRNARRSAGFWRAVGSRSSPPTEGERRQARLISQVTGQKGGRRRATRPGRLPLFVVLETICGKTDP